MKASIYVVVVSHWATRALDLIMKQPQMPTDAHVRPYKSNAS